MSVFRKQTSRKGSVVYEQVLQKNFEIIETFLKKFHQIFIKQDQFQEHLNKFAQRFTEYDELFDEFRQEQKLSVVMLQKKVNNMKSNVRQSHRASHRFSKINIPVFEATQTAQGNKNYTLLKFDSIQNQSQQNEEMKLIKKQSESTILSTKQYDQMKESIDSVRQEITQMKDKISFLSAYTSSISNQQGAKSKLQTLKKNISQSLQQEVKAKIEKEIRTQMIETEKVFIQQINNLAMQFSDQLTDSAEKKYQKIYSDLAKLDGLLFTNQQAENLKQQLKKDMKTLASQCIKIFSNKQDTRKSISLLERKVRILESNLKQSCNKSDEQKQQVDHFQSFLQVTSPNNHHNPSKSSSLHKHCKSHSQMSKQKHHSSSVTLDDDSKENTARKTYGNPQELTKNSLFTSQISKQFMKNFGVKQRKLIKTNFQTKKQFNQPEQSLFSNKMFRPQTAIRQSKDST